MILNGNNITTAVGNTVNLKINLERAGGFGENDKVLLKIRRRTGGVLWSEILSITDDNAVFFVLDSVESQSVPSGNHLWDMTVYINAAVDGDDIVSADEVITPFVSARFDIVAQESREDN